jgi:SAM-dependent methyltransferase
MKRHTFDRLQVKGGDHLLEVGCGAGDDVLALARLVGRTGRVVGLDSSEAMITEARKRAAGSDLPVEYRVGDALHLDFADNTFDGCRAERVFVHLENPRQALAELVRVARPGARIVMLDPDFETQIVDAQDRIVTRKFMNFCCDHKVRHGWLGRQLPVLFHQAGLTDVAVFADTSLLTDYATAVEVLRLQETAELSREAGAVSAAEAANWLAEPEQASKAGRFFLALTFFCVSGRKPQ